MQGTIYLEDQNLSTEQTPPKRESRFGHGNPYLKPFAGKQAQNRETLNSSKPWKSIQQTVHKTGLTMRISEPGGQGQVGEASRAEKQVNTSLRSLEKSSLPSPRRVPVVANFNNKESQFTLGN